MWHCLDIFEWIAQFRKLNFSYFNIANSMRWKKTNKTPEMLMKIDRFVYIEFAFQWFLHLSITHIHITHYKTKIHIVGSISKVFINEISWTCHLNDFNIILTIEFRIYLLQPTSNILFLKVILNIKLNMK